MSSVSKHEKVGNITLNIDATVSKKAQLATVFIQFGDNSTSDLLSKFLWIYSQEKVIPGFMNGNTFTYNAVAGNNSITFTCPDSKIFIVIQLLYLYLLKLKYPSNIVKLTDLSGDGVDQFYKRLQTINISILGKCKSTYAKITGKDKKYEMFKTNLDELYKKYNKSGKLSGSPGKDAKMNEITLEMNKSVNSSLFNLYFSIILGDLPCVFKCSGTNVTIKFIDPCATCWCPILKNYVQARIKAFFSQFGAIGSEPSDSSKKASYKAKVEAITESLHAACDIICKQHGVSYSKLNVDGFRNIDSDVVAAIKFLKSN